MKQCRHLVEINIFSLDNVNQTYMIMTNLLEHLKILIFKVNFHCWKMKIALQSRTGISLCSISTQRKTCFHYRIPRWWKQLFTWWKYYTWENTVFITGMDLQCKNWVIIGKVRYSNWNLVLIGGTPCSWYRGSPRYAHFGTWKKLWYVHEIHVRGTVGLTPKSPTSTYMNKPKNEVVESMILNLV